MSGLNNPVALVFKLFLKVSSKKVSRIASSKKYSALNTFPSTFCLSALSFKILEYL